MFTPDEVSYYTSRVRHSIEIGDYEKALSYGRKSRHTSKDLSALRAFALYKQGQLDSRLFEFALEGGTDVLSLIPQDDLSCRLCAFLLEKDLDAFVRLLKEHYTLQPNALPKHYREAMVCYLHHCSSPQADYKDNLFEADYADYQRMEKDYSDNHIRKNILRAPYGTTYWYYYDY
jgi:hypothetical protein